MVKNATPLLRIEGLTKRFGWLPALWGINCELARGQIVAILGANGSGKSTLLRLCAGLLRPSEGRIHIGGWELPQEAMKIRANVGYVGHLPLLDEVFTLRENLVFFAKCYGLDVNARVSEMLYRTGLSEYADLTIRQLSQGRQQLLNIARACLHEPDLLLLDEPMSNLDIAAVDRVFRLLEEARARDGLILWVTHDLARAAEYAERTLVLHSGRLVFDGAYDEAGKDLACLVREKANTSA